jgi:hypothetical protein
MLIVEDRVFTLGVTLCAFEERQVLDILGHGLRNVLPEAWNEPLPPNLQELADALADRLAARERQRAVQLVAAE